MLDIEQTSLPANPLLASLKMPGRVFPLPSAGLFYTNGELSPDVVKGEVQVFPMSGLAEMKFRSPDLLYSGKAVTEVIRECIPSILKPEKIISKDIDTLLSYIKIVTYGETLEISTKHTCDNAKEHSYAIDLEKIVSSTKYLTKDLFDMVFSIKLSNGQEVKLNPLSWENAIELMQMSSMEKINNEDIDTLYASNILGMIHSIDGIIDRKLIMEWVRVAPAPFTKEIQKSVNKGLENWGTDFSSEVTCQDCHKKFTINIDLNPSSFFSQ